MFAKTFPNQPAGADLGGKDTWECEGEMARRWLVRFKKWGSNQVESFHVSEMEEYELVGAAVAPVGEKLGPDWKAFRALVVNSRLPSNFLSLLEEAEAGGPDKDGKFCAYCDRDFYAEVKPVGYSVSVTKQGCPQEQSLGPDGFGGTVEEAVDDFFANLLAHGVEFEESALRFALDVARDDELVDGRKTGSYTPYSVEISVY